ncbi:MAG: dihydroneopterin aldolase [Synechococcus sp.]
MHTDKIHVSDIRCYGYTGLLPEEQVLGQWFVVDLTLWTNLRAAGDSDDIEDTVDYVSAIQAVKDVVKQKTFKTIEALAKAISEELLALVGVEQVNVHLTKCAPPIPDFDGEVSVDITRP